MSILVGIDDSPQSAAALEWAAREAALRGVALSILHVFPWPIDEATGSPGRLLAWQDAGSAVARAAHRARQIHPEVSADIVVGGPSTVLIKRSEDHELIVLGTRGRGGFQKLLVGSVALQVAGHAACSVTLVRGEPSLDAQDIVVGVGNRPDDRALGIAFEEASLRGVRLRAVHAWRPATAGTPRDLVPLVSTMREFHAEAERILTRALTPWRDKYPQVEVQADVVSDAPRHALIEASGHAALLVTGPVEHSELVAMALGSVAHAVIHHARSPVLIAR